MNFVYNWLIHGHQKTVVAHLQKLAAQPAHHAPTHPSNETVRQKMLFRQQEIVPHLQYGNVHAEQGRRFICLCAGTWNDTTSPK